MIPTLAERSRQRQLRAMAQQQPRPPLAVCADPPLGLLAYLAPGSPADGTAGEEAAADGVADESAEVRANADPEDALATILESAIADVSTVLPLEGPGEGWLPLDDEPLPEASVCAGPPEQPLCAEARTEPVSTEALSPEPAGQLQPVVARRAEVLELMLWLLLMVLDGSLAVLELQRRRIGRATAQRERAAQRLKPRRRPASAPLAAVAPSAAMTA